MTPVLATQGYSGRAVGAICVAIAALTLGLTTPLIALLMGPLTVLLALRARRHLRSRPGQQGWGLSLAAMIIGTTMTMVALVPFLPTIFFWLMTLLPG